MNLRSHQPKNPVGSRMLRRTSASVLVVALICMQIITSSLNAQTTGITITHGPMLGNLTKTSVRVWARTSQPATFFIRYSTSPDLMQAQTSKDISTTWEHDVTGWVELSGLKSNTKYYYAVVLENKVIDTKVADAYNSFTTLPDEQDFTHPDLNPDGLFNFSFEIGTGNSQSRGSVELPPTYGTMLKNLKDKVHFQIQNGDWIYEEGRGVTAQQWAQKNNVKSIPENVLLARGITGVWENYKIYLDRSKDLSNFYREVPQFVTLDDHESLNDATGSGQIGLRTDARNKAWQSMPRDGNVVDNEVERAVFRDPALSAWDDYVGWSNPDIGRHQPALFGLAKLRKGSNVLVDAKADFTKIDLNKTSNLHIQWGYGNTGVYEIVKVLGPDKIQLNPAPTITESAAYSIGTNRYSQHEIGNAAFFLLDTRSERTLHTKEDPDDSETRMIGARQEEWLFSGLKNTKADFIFIVSSVNLAVPHDNGAWYGQGSAGAGKDDGWTAHLHQREKIIDVAISLGKPVIFLTGDLHKSFVARITPGVYDIATGPHTSGAHRLGDAGGSPPSGFYDSHGRLVNLLWTSTQFRNDSDRKNARGWPVYTVIRVNNVYNVPDSNGSDRWIAYPEPQVIIEFHDGYTGELSFAYAVSTSDARKEPTPVPSERVKVLGGIPNNPEH